MMGQRPATETGSRPWFPGPSDGEEMQLIHCLETTGTFLGDENILDHECGDGYMIEYTYY